MIRIVLNNKDKPFIFQLCSVINCPPILVQTKIRGMLIGNDKIPKRVPRFEEVRTSAEGRENVEEMQSEPTPKRIRNDPKGNPSKE
ncbi:MAG: hypothetical protein V3V00_09155 [Saprospiraceae bacterium]